MSDNRDSTQTELDRLRPPAVDVIGGLGSTPHPAELDSDLAQLRERMRTIELGIFSILLDVYGEQTSPEHRASLQFAIVTDVGENPARLLSFPSATLPATRMFLDGLAPVEADRLMIAAMNVILSNRLERAEARIAELEFDLVVARQGDPPSVELG